MDRIPHNLINVTLQRASYQLGDLYNSWPKELRVFFLITAQSFVRSITPTMSEDDQKLFKYVLDNTEAIVLPSVFDPRRKHEGGADRG